MSSHGDILDLSVYGDRRTSATAVEFLADNSIIATFSVDAFGGGNGDLAVVKFSSEFEIIWDKTFGGDMSDFASDIHIRNDGSIIIAGATTTSESTDRDGWVLCLNSSGNLLWETFIDIGGSDYISSVDVDEKGIILLTGVTTCFGNRDVWILQMTADGNYNHTPTRALICLKKTGRQASWTSQSGRWDTTETTPLHNYHSSRVALAGQTGNAVLHH